MEKLTLIPNATGPSNIGDMAMLEALRKLIYKYVPDTKIMVHSTEPERYQNEDEEFKHTLYSYVAFENRNNFVRIFRLLRLSLYYFVFKFHLDRLAETIAYKDMLFELCMNYKDSEITIFVGGGYLRAKPGTSQALNLIMQLFMISFAKLFKSYKVISPISFGPFAYLWQEKLSSYILNGMDVVAAREEISFERMKASNIKNIILSADHALLLDASKHWKSKRKNNIIGFTLRGWFKGSEQIKFESQVINALATFALENNYEVLPILQVDSPHYGDIDRIVSNRVIEGLISRGVVTKSLIKVTDLESANRIYSSVDFLLGMRMHSNILAAIQGTPFVAISYEYKTEGISRLLGVEAFCIKAEEVTVTRLLALLRQQDKQKVSTKRKIIRKITEMQLIEREKWERILNKFT